LVSKSLKDWDLNLTDAKLTYTRAPSYATKDSSFDCVYGINPFNPINLLPVLTESKLCYENEEWPREMKKLHDHIKAHIKKANAAYKAIPNKHRKHMEFSPAGLVWLHLGKVRFPSRRESELMATRDGPFKVIERIEDNAYKLQLPKDIAVPTTFNIGNLSPYMEDYFEEPLDLRTNPLEEGEVDEDHGATAQGRDGR